MPNEKKMGQEHQKMGNYQTRIYVSPQEKKNKKETSSTACSLKKVGQGFLVGKFLNQITHQWSSVSHRNEPALVSLCHTQSWGSQGKMVSAQTWQWISELSSWDHCQSCPL